MSVNFFSFLPLDDSLTEMPQSVERQLLPMCHAHVQQHWRVQRKPLLEAHGYQLHFEVLSMETIGGEEHTTYRVLYTPIG